MSSQSQSDVSNQSQKDHVFEGLFRISKNGKTGFIDRTGKIVIPPETDPPVPDYGYPDFKEGLARIRVETEEKDPSGSGNKSKTGYIDMSGKVVIAPQFDVAFEFSEGLALVAMDHKFGFIDKTGRMVIPAQWGRAVSFSEGLALVTMHGKNGFIDKTGKVVIPLQFDSATSFSEGLAVVLINRKPMYIDKSGQVVLRPEVWRTQWASRRVLPGSPSVINGVS